MIKVFIPWLEPEEKVVIAGDSKRLGQWNPSSGRNLKRISKFYFYNDITIKDNESWKLVIIDDKGNITWEYGENRISKPNSVIWFRGGRKASGVATPLFSLRSDCDNGVGDFSSLKHLIRMVQSEGHKVIELLPINDTLKNPDPYQIISVFAINPVYISLDLMGCLEDVDIAHSIADRSAELIYSQYVEWEDVYSLKWDYFRAIYNQDGNKTINSKAFKTFLKNEKQWLIPYATFCYLSTKYKTTDYQRWESYSTFSNKLIEELTKDPDINNELYFYIFLQYHAYSQLSEVKKYADKMGVMLKTNITIGIAKNNVDGWQFPDLFEKEMSAGVEPEAELITGQKWPFSPINWKNSKTWWIRRISHLSRFFDICSIDHIKGYFRIWEVPEENAYAIRGHYSPEVAYSQKDIKEACFKFDKNRDTYPYITREYLKEFFGEDFKRFGEFFKRNNNENLFFKSNMSTSADIIQYFSDRKGDETALENGLLRLQDECLFVRIQDKYIPRIAAQYTNCYKVLDEDQKEAFNKLYDDFYYRRNIALWKKTGYERLKLLTDNSNILFCGEDLGDIPEYIHEVMSELGILSLKVERFKNPVDEFNDVNEFPYMSVSVTSTLDMKPIVEWWRDERIDVQRYWNTIMGNNGRAPEKADTKICKEIVNRTLNSNSALSIIPVNDWLSILPDYPKFTDYNGVERSRRVSNPNDKNQMWNLRIDQIYTLSKDVYNPPKKKTQEKSE